jgi:hypothetical protein
LGEALFRTYHVDDPLTGVVDVEEGYPMGGAVVSERLDLETRPWVSDAQAAPGGGDGVVEGGNGQIGSPDTATGESQPGEGLRAGDLMDQVKVDEEETGVVSGDRMAVPCLLEEG